MDRLTSMAVFVRAVETGSFAAAAAALDISAPMVGKHVRFLEDRLGMRLLNRTTRRQSLTEFGRAYYDRCRQVLAEADAADALAADQLGQPSGRLRVTMPVLFGRHCAAPILRGLVRRYPKLDLDLSFSDRLADLAEDGFDLALRTGELGNRAGVMARRVASQPMVVVGAPCYLDARGRPRQPEDLAAHDLLIYSRSGRVPPWLFPLPDDSTAPPFEFAPAQPRLRLDDMDAIADAAAAGFGLAWLPWWLVRGRIAAGELELLWPERSGFLYDCYALWLQVPRLPLRLRMAIDALAEGLPRLMSA